MWEEYSKLRDHISKSAGMGLWGGTVRRPTRHKVVGAIVWKSGDHVEMVVLS